MMIHKIYHAIRTMTLPQRWDGVMYALIIGIGLWWCAIAFVQYQDFGMRGSDSAVAEQALWNTVFTGQLFQQSFLHLPDEPNLREHLNFVQFLYLPVYALVPHTLTLLVFAQILFVWGSCALYRHARRRIGRAGATVAVAIFMMHPLVVSQVVHQMHVVALAGVFILFMLMAYEERRLRAFVIWTVLTGCVTEFVAPTVFLVGVIALIDRRTWAWVLTPMTVGVAMYVAAKYYITIGFSAHDRIVARMTPHALMAMDQIDKRFDVIVDMLKPVAVVLPLFSRYVLLLAPTIAIILFIAVGGRLKSGAHVFVLVPAIIVMIFVDLAQRWSGTRKVFVLYVLVAMGMMTSSGAWWDMMHAQRSDLAPALRSAVLAVKDGGSVTADSSVGTHVCRRAIFDIPSNERMTDYIVLKESKYASTKKRDPADVSRFVDRVAANPAYRTVFRDGRVVVFATKEKVRTVLAVSLEDVEKMSDGELQDLWARVPMQKHYNRQIL